MIYHKLRTVSIIVLNWTRGWERATGPKLLSDFTWLRVDLNLYPCYIQFYRSAGEIQTTIKNSWGMELGRESEGIQEKYRCLTFNVNWRFLILGSKNDAIEAIIFWSCQTASKECSICEKKRHYREIKLNLSCYVCLCYLDLYHLITMTQMAYSIMRNIKSCHSP